MNRAAAHATFKAFPMSNPTYTNLPSEKLDSDALAELALNLRWSWNHTTDELWKRLDPELWELTQNPWVILQMVSQDKLKSVSSDPAFRQRIDHLLALNRKAVEPSGWFHQAHAESPLTAVAYFSMEFMLSEALPIYSGGLGNVAGDQLKAASNLGVPVIGVGLLYAQGYFRQEIDSQGFQQALYPFNDPGQLPIKPLRQPNGEWLRLQIDLPGSKLWIRTWEVRVGRTKLYLLDTNDPANLPSHQCITSELYGGGPELRLKQELVLGIGGWRLLRTLGIHPEVCHLNEGHAAFAVLERARCFMADHNKPFAAALNVTRSGNLFTTHTAVEAGFDRFAPGLAGKYLKDYAERQLGISLPDLLALGRRDPNDPAEPFNMAYLAVRGSGSVNGVSKLHGEVSRRIFQPLFPRWPEAEVPIGHVTNGVHTPTWDSAESDALWTEACGQKRWLGAMATMQQDIRCLSDSRLWQLRTNSRKALIEQTRKRLARQLAEQDGSRPEAVSAERLFDVDVLTLGFARRFATYKRPNLLLHDPERLVRTLNNRDRPVQLILAGKAHPQDLAGQALIKQWTDFTKRPDVRSRVVFLSDYDMLMTQQLVQGIDVWINTPRRPWEASGTSGMKVLVNGGLNLSELDGWWAEAYSPDLGWDIGDRQEHGDDPAWDAAEAEALYAVLEREVIPEFYDRDDQGIPVRWVARIRESMSRLTPVFSASRVISEYTEEHYLPAARAYNIRAAKAGEFGVDLLQWQQDIAKHWEHVRFGSVSVETRDGQHSFSVQVYLDELHQDAVQVELYAETGPGDKPIRQTMTRCQALVGSAGGYLYSAQIPAARPASDYTPRIVPYKAGASVPLEAAEVRWQR
jgi:starch phosphorylase